MRYNIDSRLCFRVYDAERRRLLALKMRIARKPKARFMREINQNLNLSF